ncbi:unnamed protein product [Cochlearia groenlandica]
MNLQLEPPEKKRRSKKTPDNSSSPPSNPSFTLLPYEIAENCLARVSRKYTTHHSLSFREPSAQFSHPPISTQLDSHLGVTEQKKKKKKTPKPLLVPINSSEFPSLSESTAVIGSEIYVIGGPVDGSPSFDVRVLDCRSHTWRDAPSMNVSRKLGETHPA